MEVARGLVLLAKAVGGANGLRQGDEKVCGHGGLCIMLRVAVVEERGGCDSGGEALGLRAWVMGKMHGHGGVRGQHWQLDGGEEL